MASDAENFWQAVEKIEQSAGAFGALIFIIAFAAIYFGIILLAAWAVSHTLNTAYWMTVLSISLLKLALK